MFRPTAANDYVRIIGYFISGDAESATIWFDPDKNILLNYHKKIWIIYLKV